MGNESPKSIIELNGQRYNAHTGKLLDQSATATANHPKPTTGQAMDVKRAPRIAHAVQPSKSVHKSAQPSQTLMRKAVKKPSVITTRETIAMDVVQPHQASAASFHQVSRERLHRAEHVRQNPLITRFTDFSESAKHHIQELSETIQPATVPVHEPIAAALAPAPQVGDSAKHNKTNKMLERGMRAAESHTAKTAKKAHLHHRIGRKIGLSARGASIAAGSMAVLAFGAFFAYQNIPSINVRYAAAKSGVHASLPGYQPSGFAVSKKIQYGPGIIEISYKANADSRSYHVIQKNTSWDSQALKEHLASTAGMTPQTYPDNGRTIYLHGDSNADWVAGGVWYSVAGDASLSTDQLIKIASSI